MGANPEIVHQVVIVPDELTGISLRRMYIEPPIKNEDIYLELEAEIAGAELVHTEDSKGRTKYLIRDGETKDNRQVIDQVDKTLQKFGRSAIPLEGLHIEPTCKEYAGFISRRAWEMLPS